MHHYILCTFAYICGYLATGMVLNVCVSYVGTLALCVYRSYMFVIRAILAQVRGHLSADIE